MFGFYDSYFLFFGLSITYYGFIIAIGMAVGVLIACKNAKFRGLKSEDLILGACYVLPLAIIGARLYYVIFADHDFSFGEIFAIWDGGMAIYGGIIGGAIGVILFCAIHKKNFLDVADIAVPSLILGQAIGRIGCYFAGCCYGVEVTEPNLMWFPLSTQIDGIWHYSTFFYESLWDLLGCVVLLLCLRKSGIKVRGVVMSLYLIIYGSGRAWIEGMRGDSLYIGSLRVSQVLSIILVIAGVITLTVLCYLTEKGKLKSIKEKGFPEFVIAQNALIIQKREERKNKRVEKRLNRKKNQRKDNKTDKVDDNITANKNKNNKKVE